MFLSAFAVVRHAEALAVKLGEPYGTLILTLAITGIEVIDDRRHHVHRARATRRLARDAMMAVVMIVLNGMLGVSLIVGGLRYREQAYNLQGANSFLAVILPLAVLGLVQPNFTVTTPGPVYSPVQAAFLSLMSLVLYGVFLGMQTSRHREYFVSPNEAAGGERPSARPRGPARLPYHAVMLFVYMRAVRGPFEADRVPINHAISGAARAARARRPPHLGADPVARVADRGARGARQPAAALGERPPRLGAREHRPDDPCGARGRLRRPGTRSSWAWARPTSRSSSSLSRSAWSRFAAPRTNVLLGAVHLLVFFAYLLFIFER